MLRCQIEFDIEKEAMKLDYCSFVIFTNQKKFHLGIFVSLDFIFFVVDFQIKFSNTRKFGVF